MTEKIDFTDFSPSINQIQIARRVHYDFVPANWFSINVTAPQDKKSMFGANINTSNVVNWVIEHTNGRFGVINRQYHGVTIYFEDDQDAVLFRLLEGDKALYE